MTLPAALLNRLAKRGIVQKQKNDTHNTDKDDKQHETNEEEIIAESYDPDPDQYEYISKKRKEDLWSDRMKRTFKGKSDCAGCKGCPNKYNIHHKCTLYCASTWGEGKIETSVEYKIRQQRLLKRFPLPKNWEQVYDSGCGAHYYWNQTDDTVSWLPPNHPKSEIGKSAAHQRREMEEDMPDIDDTESSTPRAIIVETYPPQNTDSDTEANLKPPVVLPPRKPKARDLEKTLRSKSDRKSTRREKRIDLEPLDPMDPAAYSDTPRGKWSSGLNPVKNVDDDEIAVIPTPKLSINSDEEAEEAMEMD